MAQIYGELIRAQLQSSATNLSSAAPGLIYLNSGDKKPTVYDGTSWQKLVNEAALSDLSALPIITLAKGGLGADASAWSGFVKISAGTASAAALSASDLPIVTAAKGGLGVDASAFAGVVKAAAGVFSASTIVNADVSATAAIDYSKLSVPDAAIPQAKVANLTTDLGNKVEANSAIVAATKTKITYDAKGLVTAGEDLVSDDIPATLLSKVVSSTAALTGALTLPVGTTADRTGLSTQGMVRYNTTDATFEGYNGTSWGAIGGGGGGTIDTITQASHGFVVGDVLYLNGATYAKAKADAANTAEVVGVVSSVITSSQFQLTLSGEVSGLTGLVAGEVYFLSADTSGALTTTEPTTIGYVSLPVGVASSTTSLYVAPKRGVVVGGSNARTSISLLNAPTVNTVQNVAAYDAGELTGWVSISATTPLRFYVSAQFSKNGAGNNYNISYQTSGDAPPAGFLVSITSAGLIQIQLATSAITGFTSATINYALNAPAVGTSLPLSVQSSSIVWSEPVAFRNRLINGEMKIAQYGSTAISNNQTRYGGCDRWAVNLSGFTTGSGTISRGGPTSDGSYVQQVQATTTGSGTISFQQRIEAINCADLNGKTVTVSVTLYQTSGSTISPTINFYKPTAFDNWTAITFISGQSVSLISGERVRFTYTTTLGSTDASNGLSVQINMPVGAVTGAFFQIQDVQLELGSVATPIEKRPIGTELALCQRYAELIGIVGGTSRVGAGVALAFTATQALCRYRFIVTKRAQPVFSYITGSATSFRLLGNAGAPAVSSISFDEVTINHLQLTCGTAGLVTGYAYELQSNDVSFPVILISSEL